MNKTCRCITCFEVGSDLFLEMTEEQTSQISLAHYVQFLR